MLEGEYPTPDTSVETLSKVTRLVYELTLITHITL